MYQVYGIRHHGPGSARALLQALESQQPDLILIEGPPDADALIAYVAHPDMRPPVALLLYNPKDLQQAVYYPFASFSPEWQAMSFALEKDIPCQFMDLPQAIYFGLQQKTAQTSLLDKKIPNPIDRHLIQDPLGAMAAIAGYKDSERWWEVTFEQNKGFKDTFAVIAEMIVALRQEVAGAIPRDTLLREAAMRKKLRTALKKGFENIAIVCGAWHIPALQNINGYKASKDNAILRGLKKVKPAMTWIPWTYQRLSRQSGYRAGVYAPAWYELLFSQREETIHRWMTQVARLLRETGIDVSSAHTIEAVRLAQTLAAIRNIAIPGIDTLFEAANTVFGEGDTTRLDLVKERLVVGDTMGHVPTAIPVVPLQKDLEQHIKSARLTKAYKTSGKVEKKLDLRKPTNLAASHLLHRLMLLDIPWGKEEAVSKYNTGRFTENWVLHWVPDFIIKIIEAGMWGNTIEEATSVCVKNSLASKNTLADITALLERTLKANLPQVIPDLIQKLQILAAQTKDVLLLMGATFPLVQVLRYGSTRRLEVASVEAVLVHIVPRICVGLPNACMGIDNEVADVVFQKIIQTNHSIHLYNEPSFINNWHQTLQTISDTPTAHGKLRGGAIRILMDKNAYDVPKVAQTMRFVLSSGNDKTQAVYWMEGFLHGSGLLLIHHPVLWQILDNWVAELKMEQLTDMLPLLRRTFSKFSASERKKMLALAADKPDTRKTLSEKETLPGNIENETLILPTIHLLLGRN